MISHEYIILGTKEELLEHLSSFIKPERPEILEEGTCFVSDTDTVKFDLVSQLNRISDLKSKMGKVFYFQVFDWNSENKSCTIQFSASRVELSSSESERRVFVEKFNSVV